MLYVESDLGAMYARARLYGLIVLLVIGVSLPLAYLISRRLQHQLLRPILALADTTRAVSERHDYTVRAAPTGAYEFDLFTDTFNQMLTQIQGSEGKLHAQLGRLEPAAAHHPRDWRAAGPAEHLSSGAAQPGRESADRIRLLSAARPRRTIADRRARWAQRANSSPSELGLTEQLPVPIDQNGLSRCVAGQLVYEPDVLQVPFPFPQRLAARGLRSVVFAPLIVENQVFGVLVCARAAVGAFSSGECEFLQQLSEHVALASHQARLYGALQQAYDDLRQQPAHRHAAGAAAGARPDGQRHRPRHQQRDLSRVALHRIAARARTQS